MTQSPATNIGGYRIYDTISQTFHTARVYSKRPDSYHRSAECGIWFLPVSCGGAMSIRKPTEIQAYLEDCPSEASTYTCPKCNARIRDAEYRVSPDGIVTHGHCLRAAMDLLKQQITPENSGPIHDVLYRVVNIARAAGLMDER